MELVAIWIIGLALVFLGGAVLFTALTARGVEKAVPPLGRFIDIDGAPLHYLDQGSGPAIVMIHGLGSQMRNFTYALLAKMGGSFRIILLDRPGSGYSKRAAGTSARLSAQAQTIAKLIIALGLERPLIMGHSLGGAVALALALNHPDQVGGLAVESPILRWLIAWTFATPASMRNGPVLIATVFGPDPVPQDFATKGGGLLSLRPCAFYGASSDLVAVRDDLPAMVSRYASLTIPVGVLAGTGDLILDYGAHAEALAKKVPGLDLELVENGGHMIPLTAPERSARFIIRMARRVSAAKAAAPAP
jgi:pimeloyl-ACP methyl ester carboxylesterase